MNKAFGWALLAAGIALIIFGIGAQHTVGSSASRFFSGTPTHKSVWFLLGGMASTLIGAVMTFKRSKT
jgi:hypothetical protein